MKNAPFPTSTPSAPLKPAGKLFHIPFITSRLYGNSQRQKGDRGSRMSMVTSDAISPFFETGPCVQYTSLMGIVRLPELERWASCCTGLAGRFHTSRMAWSSASGWMFFRL